MRIKRGFFILALTAAICLSLTGCFKGEADITIDEDGSVSSKMRLVGVEFITEAIEDMKNSTLQGSGNVKVAPVTDGNMTGYELSSSYPDIDAFAKSGSNMVRAQNGKNKGIQAVNGWFYDAYSFDLIMEANGNAANSAEDEQMARAFLSQVRFDFNMNLPYPADSNNADTVSNEGKNLYWNLATTLTSNQDKSMRASFRIWHKERIAITVAVGILLLIAALFFAWKAFRAEPGAGKNVNYAAAVLALILILGIGGFAAYKYFVPPTFTDKDVISAAVAAESPAANDEKAAGKNAAAPAKQTETAAVTKTAPESDASLKAVQEVLKKHGLADTAEATSYGHDNNGSLSIISSPQGKRLFLIDNINNQVALVDLTPDVYNFAQKNQGAADPPPVIFNVTILNDVRGADGELGVWNASDHSFGIYALYKFAADGSVVPGMLTSGAGLHPSHYQAYLKERKNVDLANLFLTENQALHADANRRNVKI